MPVSVALYDQYMLEKRFNTRYKSQFGQCKRNRLMSHLGRKRSVGRRDPADHSGRQPALNRCYFNLFNRQEPSQFFRVYPNQIPPSAAIDVDAIQLQD